MTLDTRIPHSHFGTSPEATPTARHAFLRTLFGITGEYCRALLFDGYSFQLRTQVPYQEVESIECETCEEVTVAASRVPANLCRYRFRHSCVDGSPDLRYHDNPHSVHATRCTVAFRGRSVLRLHVFCAGRGQADYALEHFNAMLRFTRRCNIETYFLEYQADFEKSQRIRTMLEELDRRRRAGVDIRRAFASLSENLRARAGGELREGHHRAIAGLTGLESTLQVAKDELRGLERKMRLNELRGDIEALEKLDASLGRLGS
jgi:hypothetical protein